MKIEEPLLKKNSKMIFYRKVMARCWKRLPFRRTICVEKGWHSPRAAPPNIKYRIRLRFAYSLRPSLSAFSVSVAGTENIDRSANDNNL